MHLRMNLIWLTVLAAMQFALTSAKTSPLLLVEAVLESANKVADIIGKVNDITLGPSIRAMDDKIKKIDTNIEGITKEEKELVRKSWADLINSRKEVTLIRALLETLAEDSISTAENLKHVITKMEVGLSDDRIKKYIDYSAQKMISLIERSTIVLTKSKMSYNVISKRMTNIETHLGAFSRSLYAIRDKEGPRFKKWVSDTRAIVYGAGAACVATGPLMVIGCPGYYATAAIVLETKIAEYQAAVKRVQDACNTALVSSATAITEVKSISNTIEFELISITRWKGKLTAMQSVDFKSVDNVAFLVGMNRKGAIKMLSNLQCVCQEYLDKKKLNNCKYMTDTIIKTPIKTIQTQITPIQTQITPIKTQITPIKTQITHITTQNTPVKTQITNIETAVIPIKTQITDKTNDDDSSPLALKTREDDHTTTTNSSFKIFCNSVYIVVLTIFLI